MSGLSENELIHSGRSGETAAINELFERYYPVSLKVARRILDSESESQDAVQSAYCDAFQHLDTFRGEASFRTWITRIVVNRCLMARRDPWRRRRLACLTASEGDYLQEVACRAASPEKSAWCREVASAHDRAVLRLQPKLRAAYVHYVISDMSIAEVAVTLGLSIPATKTRLFRARNAMRQSLGHVWRGANVDGAIADRSRTKDLHA